MTAGLQYLRVVYVVGIQNGARVEQQSHRTVKHTHYQHRVATLLHAMLLQSRAAPTLCLP